MRYFLCCIFFLCTSFAFGQVSENVVDLQRNVVFEIEKQKPSFQRDTSLAIEYAKLAKIFVDESADSLLHYQKKAEILAYKTQCVKALGYIEMVKGVYYREQGFYTDAIKYFMNAIDIWDDQYPIQTATALSDLGTVYTYTKHYQKAIEYHRKSKAIFNKLNITIGVIDNDANIGNAYLENNLPNKALPYFLLLNKIYNTKTIAIDDVAGHKCVNYINLCTTYLRLNKLENARMYEDSANKYCEIINGIAEKQYLVSEFVKYYISNKNFDKALDYLSESEKMATLLNSEAKKCDNLYLKYQIYKSLNSSDSALLFYEKYNQLSQKLNREKSEIEIKYDTFSKQKEIDKLSILNQKNTQIFLMVFILFLLSFSLYTVFNNRKLRRKNQEISEAMLQGQTLERKRVAADLHDNLGSTMSSLIWTMEAIDSSKLQEDERKVYQNLKKMLSNAYDEVRLLSHNLLPEEFEKQGLSAALQYFVRKVNQNSSIKFELQIDDTIGKLDKKVEFELYSICLELVNNILKHSKATEAKIKLFKVGNNVKLIVEDNGIGIFENNSDGKGMKNVRARVESLKGIWNLYNLENKGVINEITIKV